MDEEELEQPRKKITISNFFESIQSIDKVANRALKKTESNLGIISENKSLIEALSKSFDNIITEVREIKEYVMIKDEDKDKLFSQEDQEQKIKRLERLQGLGDKPSKDDKDFKKQAAETVKSALQDPNVMQMFTGLIGLSVSGLLGLGASALGMTNSKNTVTQDRGFLGMKSLADILTLGLSDFDQMGRGIIPISKEQKEKLTEKPRGLSRIFGGVADLIMRDTTDFDKRGSESTYKSGVNKEKEIKKLDDKEDEKLVPNNLAPKEVKKKDNRTFEEKFLDEGINDIGIFKVEKILKEKKEQNQEDKIPNFKFGTEIGGVDGPDGVDRIPAMLTKGETVLSKDESENLKEMGVFNVDRLVSGMKKMYNKDDEVDKFSFEMMKKFEGYSGTAYPDVVDDDGNVLQYAIGYGSSFLPPFITGEEKSRPVRKSDKITKKQATELKEFDIDRIQDTINSELSEVGLKLDDLPVRVSSVLTSLGFNYGSLEGVHPLKDRKFNEGKSDTDKSKYTQSVVQMIKSGHDKNDFTNFANFLEFNKSQDKPGTGLEARRKDESLIIKTGSGSDYYGLQNLNIPESSDDLQSLSENNSISPIIESKSNQLAENIFTSPSTENNKINLLPIPMNQQQSQPTDGNVIVAAPKNTPQVTTTPVESTISSVSFVNMISNKELSIG